MSGFMNPLYYLVLSAALIGGWLLLRRWYAVDSQRSLLVLCILLTPISVWLAMIALVIVKWASLRSILLGYAHRFQSK
jgi:hypothetical protein